MVPKVFESLKFDCIFNFGVLTVNLYSKPLESNIVHILITLSQVTSVTSELTVNLSGRSRFSAVRRNSVCKCFTASAIALIQDFLSRF